MENVGINNSGKNSTVCYSDFFELWAKISLKGRVCWLVKGDKGWGSEEGGVVFFFKFLQLKVTSLFSHSLEVKEQFAKSAPGEGNKVL